MSGSGILGIKNLKPTFKISDNEVECPHVGCNQFVKRRQSGDIVRSPDHFCDKHSIFITTTTFIYRDCKRNLIWKDDEDIALLDQIMGSKTESRMDHDNSEDALSWNVFRYFDKTNLLSELLYSFSGKNEKEAKIYYWSYSEDEGRTWLDLQKSRDAFKEKQKRGSEPDLIIETDESVYFIEAKFKSNNPRNLKNHEKLNKYILNKGSWSKKVLKKDLKKLPIKDIYYELTRFWILGTWLAEEMDKRFYLINLVCENKEKNITTEFGNQIKQDMNRVFLRKTWEDIYRLLIERQTLNKESKQLINYMNNKSKGYSNGRLKKPFTFQN